MYVKTFTRWVCQQMGLYGRVSLQGQEKVVCWFQFL